MIKAYFWQSETDFFQAFLITGHSGLAPMGQDILCAALSGAAQAITMKLINIAGKNARFKRKDGFLYCSLEHGLIQREDVKALFETLFEFTKELQKQYKKSIKIVIRRR